VSRRKSTGNIEPFGLRHRARPASGLSGLNIDAARCYWYKERRNSTCELTARTGPEVPKGPGSEKAARNAVGHLTYGRALSAPGPFAFLFPKRRNNVKKQTRATPRDPQGLVHLKEAAGILGVNYFTARRWGFEGKFPMFRVGRGFRIRRSDIDTFLVAGAVAPKKSERDLRVMAAGNNSSVTTGSPRPVGATGREVGGGMR
jgi:excisionase family DNA binding protein